MRLSPLPIVDTFKPVSLARRASLGLLWRTPLTRHRLRSRLPRQAGAGASSPHAILADAAKSSATASTRCALHARLPGVRACTRRAPRGSVIRSIKPLCFLFATIPTESAGIRGILRTSTPSTRGLEDWNDSWSRLFRQPEPKAMNPKLLPTKAPTRACWHLQMCSRNLPHPTMRSGP